jgi:hypothetical protein
MSDDIKKTGVGPVTDYLASKMDEAVADEKASEKEGDRSFGRMAKNAGKATIGMGAMLTALPEMAYNKLTTGKALKNTEGMKKGGKVKTFRHHDGIAQRGKTRA